MGAGERIHRSFIESTPEYAKYVPQLRRMILLRVLKQLESVYSVMKLENYTKLLSDLHFDRYEAERLVVEAGLSNQLHIRLDYVKQCVFFNHGVAEHDVFSGFLSKLRRKWVWSSGCSVV